jgi:hypothetical protein
MASVARAEALPLTEPLPLDSIAAFRSPNADIRFSALRDFMLRMGLSLQPARADPAPKPPPKPRPPPSPVSTPMSSPIAITPKRQYQKTRDREFKYALSHGVRHSYEPYIRDISTPDWTATAPSPLSAAVAADFDICGLHRRLEVCEHRIINGRDTKRHHPAMCIEAADAEVELTADEEEKAERYAVCEIAERIPTFWPSRIWDGPEARLSEGESRRLEEMLAGNGTENVPKIVKSPIRIRPSMSPQQKVKKTTLVLLDMNDYLTDGSDEETDWDGL